MFEHSVYPVILILGPSFSTLSFQVSKVLSHSSPRLLVCLQFSLSNLLHVVVSDPGRVTSHLGEPSLGCLYDIRSTSSAAEC